MHGENYFGGGKGSVVSEEFSSYIRSHSPVIVEQSVELGALLVHEACAFTGKVRLKHSKMQILGNAFFIFSVERCFSEPSLSFSVYMWLL